jgi:hypothetical protein
MWAGLVYLYRRVHAAAMAGVLFKKNFWPLMDTGEYR